MSTLPNRFPTRGGVGVLLFLACLGSFACGGFAPRQDSAKTLPAWKVLKSSPPIPLPRATQAAISTTDLEAHVGALTSPITGGRRAGTQGEAVAADYLARAFTSVGLEPAGDDGDPRHRFSFTSGVDLGPGNELLVSHPLGEARALELDEDWRPLAFSPSSVIPKRPVVFAGYGLLAAADAGRAEIDDYAEIEVRDRWVLVFRDLPQSLEPQQRQSLQRHASLRYKAMVARDKGAVGILFASGPLGQFREELVPLRFDASLAGTRIGVVSIRDAVAEQLLAGDGGSLEAIQAGVDAQLVGDTGNTDHTKDTEDTTHEAGTSSRSARFERPGLLAAVELGGQIDLETRKAEGTNILARLQVGEAPSRQTIVLGAHFDHLGRGEGSGSLASEDEIGEIHPGADDNASGTALLIEIAELLASRKRAGLDLGQRDFIFAAWSGEELGLIGSNAWVGEHVNPHSNEEGPVAYLNFDMVGRLRDKLVVQGLGSSPDWAALLEDAAAPLTLSISTQQDSYVPTDATSFYTEGVPVLIAFTGAHSEYHTPRDTIDLLNLDGTAQIGELFTRIAEALSRAQTAPVYQAQKAPAAGQGRGGFRVFLGTIPDYAQTDIVGVRLSGVAPAGPAQTAGMRNGDIIVEVDGRPIENLYDYTYALEALRIGVPARITVRREGDQIEMEVVPSSRD